MLVIIAVPVSADFDCKPHGKAAHGLAAQMRDRRFRRKSDRITSIPDTAAQIHLFEVVEEPLVKSAEFLEQLAAKHHAAARLPIHFPLGVSLPTQVAIGQKRSA